MELQGNLRRELYHKYVSILNTASISLMVYSSPRPLLITMTRSLGINVQLKWLWGRVTFLLPEETERAIAAGYHSLLVTVCWACPSFGGE